MKNQIKWTDIPQPAVQSSESDSLSGNLLEEQKERICAVFNMTSDTYAILPRSLPAKLNVLLVERKACFDIRIDLLAQRDALLAACELAVAGLDKLASITGHESDQLNANQLRAAIALAQKGSL
jgi:hypothetical protein